MKQDSIRVLIVTRASAPRAAGEIRLAARHAAALHERLFSPVPSYRPGADCAWHPSTDVHETAHEHVIRMELAGIDRGRLVVEHHGHALVVSGYRGDACEGGDVTCHQMEISRGPFERVVLLPGPFETEAISAEYGTTSGILEIRVRKECS